MASIKFIKDNNSELVTTLESITEALHLPDFNRNAQIDFLGWVSAGAVTLDPITSYDLQRIKELTVKYSDLAKDFAGACLVFWVKN